MATQVLGSFTKLAGEKIPVSVLISGSGFVKTWQAGYFYNLNDVVKGKKVTGFQYRCTEAGQSNASQPEWPTSIGDSVVDGGCSWECEEQSNDSLYKHPTASSWSASGLTISSDQVSYADGQAKSSCFVEGGTAGQTYDVLVSITFNDTSIEQGIIKISCVSE